MLDSFIIDRIRKEREQRERAYLPLRIERPRPELPNRHQGPSDSPSRDQGKDRRDRGSTVIDFKL